MAPPSDASPVRVALIDDDSGLFTVLDRRFAALRWDARCSRYAAGPEQLAALRLHALVVNPALTGLDYIERVASALPGLALLVCSRPAPVADRVRGLRGGADDWITKPCHPEELVARIQAVLRRRRAGELPIDDEPITPASWRSAPIASTPTSARSRRRCRARSTSCCTSSPPPRAGCSSARRSISASGATRWSAATARSTCSSASCATSSSGCRRTGATCTPISASATGSRPSRSRAADTGRPARAERARSPRAEQRPTSARAYAYS